MKTSEQTDKISEALAKAQGQMTNPEKNKTAKIPMKAGGQYQYNYADLPSTFDCVRKALSDNAIMHTFGSTITEHATIVSCRISHMGQWYESEMILPESGDIKGMASNLTYMRRYLFSALVGVAGDDDTDSDPESNMQITDRRPQPPKVKINPDESDHNRMSLLARQKGIDVTALMKEKFGKVRTSALKMDEFGFIMDYLNSAISKSMNDWTSPEEKK